MEQIGANKGANLVGGKLLSKSPRKPFESLTTKPNRFININAGPTGHISQIDAGNRLKSTIVTKKRSPSLKLKLQNSTPKENRSPRSSSVKISNKSLKLQSVETTTSGHSVEDLFNNPTLISSTLDNYHKNYVYSGHVTTEKQKILDCLSDALDH